MKQYDRNEKIPLRITRSDRGHYKVFLGEIDLTMHLMAAGGFTVEMIDYAGICPIQPTITLKFAPDATELDLDADLVAYLRDLDAQDAEQ